MEDHLYTYLTAQAAITGIVGTSPNSRIWPQQVPQGTSLPALSFTTVAVQHGEHMTAATGLAASTIQIDSWATTYAGAKSLASAVRGELMAYTAAAGALGGEDIRRVTLENETDTYEQTADGSGLGTHRISQDYVFWHAETVPTF